MANLIFNPDFVNYVREYLHKFGVVPEGRTRLVVLTDSTIWSNEYSREELMAGAREVLKRVRRADIPMEDRLIRLEIAVADLIEEHGDLHALAPVLSALPMLDPKRKTPLDAYVGIHYQRGRLGWASADDGERFVMELLSVMQELGEVRAAYCAHLDPGEIVPERASDLYVTNLYTGRALDYDLRAEESVYRVPAAIARAVEAENNRLLSILDLGCGTGLCGRALTGYAAEMTGIDLSPQMLAKAELTGVYDELIRGEMVQHLSENPGRYDLIVGGGIAQYFGPLDALFQAVAGALRTGGRFVFTTEDRGGDGHRLIGGEYQHGRDYVEDRLLAAGFKVELVSHEALRTIGWGQQKGFVWTARLNPDR